MKHVLLPAIVALVCFVASLAGTYAVVPKPSPGAADSLAVSVTSEVAAPDTLHARPPRPMPFDVALRDSLMLLRRKLDTAQRKLADVTARQADRRAEAQALSGTLSKMEDDELSAILQRLDLGVVEMLYAGSSARNRTRLLQALSAERAARFVRYLTMGRSGTAVPDLPEAVTTTPEAQG